MISTSMDSSASVASAPARAAEPFPMWPHFEEDEVQAVADVLRSGRVNYWTGLHGRAFEADYAHYTGTRYAVAVANGTLALELALYALGVGPGDEVVVTSRSFIASASSVATRGATPVFADVDIDSQNITAETIRPCLTTRTKAIIAVHLAGWPCDMGPIMTLANDHGIKVIEDCAQAHGAAYYSRQVGSLGDINAFSFCQDKILSTAGEGGMVTTNDAVLWERAWSYKDHGKNFSRATGTSHAPGYRFLHDSVGSNWRLTEAQSALGRILLAKLDHRVGQRRANASILAQYFETIPAMRVSRPTAHVRHSYYKYYVNLRPERLKPGWDPTHVQQAIQNEGVPCFAGYGELYLENAFAPSLRPKHPLPNARELSRTALVFLVHSQLSADHMHRTCDAVGRVMSVASV